MSKDRPIFVYNDVAKVTEDAPNMFRPGQKVSVVGMVEVEDESDATHFK